MGKLKLRGLSETQIQQGIVSWARDAIVKYPDLRLLYMVNNGTYGSDYRRWNWLKSMGMLPGVTDLCLPIGRGNYLSAYLEVKASDKAPYTDSQKEIMPLLEKVGHWVRTVWTPDMGIKALTEYIKMPATLTIPFIPE